MKIVVKYLTKCLILIKSFIVRARESHMRMIIGICLAYFIVDKVFISSVASNIKKESNRTITSFIGDTFKEAKETASTMNRLLMAAGVDEVGIEYVKNPRYHFHQFNEVVLKRDDLSIYPGNFKKSSIPLCGANVKANINALDSKGEVISSGNFDLKIGELDLPLGLAIGLQKIKTGKRYDVIAPMMDLYFIKEPSDHIKALKPKVASKFVTYQITVDEIDKFAEIGSFEPRIFHIARGSGLPVICGSIVDFRLKISTLDNVIISDNKHIVTIDSQQLPSGVEFILRNLKHGDRASVLLNSSWMKAGNEQKLSILSIPKNHSHLIFDFVVNDVKHPAEMFFATKPEVEAMIQKSVNSNESNGQEFSGYAQ